MIEIKTLFLLWVLVIFSACSAEETIQDAVDDAKEFINQDDTVVMDGSDANITQNIQALLDVHNSARSELNANINNLIWSNTIAKDAQLYANEMAINGIWGHDTIKNQNDGYGHGNYGENLYTSSNAISLADAAQAWVDEKYFYHIGNVGDSETCSKEPCGHYTQVIWKNTTLVGCAMSQYKTDVFIDGNNAKGWNIVVCKYQTPGNYIGETPY